MTTENDSAHIANRVVDELEILPNNLTKLLYLASLRDCNTGLYLHPKLSHKIGVEPAHLAILAAHDEVFFSLLLTPVSEYVAQLEQYIRYAKAERTVALKTWQSLQAYKATVPVDALPPYCELFCLNVESAIKVLQTSNEF